MKRRVAMVVMPFASAGFPVIGVSLLQAALQRDGFDCDVHYLNLRYAGRRGLNGYHWLSESPQMAMMGEWVFAREVFGDSLPSDAEYRQEILFPRSGDNLDIRNLLDLMAARNDAGDFLEDCLGSIDWSQYCVIGFSTTFEQNLPSLALASRLKKLFPETAIVFGGNNCEGEMGIALHRSFPFVDYVCSGVGDVAFPELVNRLFDGQIGTGIDGIVARVDGQTVVPNRIVNPVSGLDSLPIPSYDGYYSQLGLYGLEGQFESLTPFESARGCWWGAKSHCTFCGLNGGSMAFSSKSPDRLLNELELLGSKYGRNFVAVDNILDLKYLTSVFPTIIERGLDYSFHYETKVNLKKHQLRTLRDAGVQHLQPGIESLSTSILQLMKKGCTALQNIEFLKWAHELGIRVVWNLLYGFPEEDPEEYRKMIALIPGLYHLQAPDYCARVRPDRFSPYFTRPDEFGLARVNPDRSYSYVYALDPEMVRQLAYFFEFEDEVSEQTKPYAEQLFIAAQEWREQPVECQLVLTASQTGVVIEDTRWAGEGRREELAPLASAIYRFCDEARSFPAITAHVCAALGRVPDGEIRDVLQRFVENRWIVNEGAAYLALATERTMDPVSWRKKNELLRRGSPWLNWKARSTLVSTA